MPAVRVKHTLQITELLELLLYLVLELVTPGQGLRSCRILVAELERIRRRNGIEKHEAVSRGFGYRSSLEIICETPSR